jgi:hypothetical protein
MANFTWTNAAGGDWSVAANWALSVPITPPRPPGSATDTAFFGDLASSYTVTVNAGTTVGNSVTGGPFIEIDPTTLTGPAFSISGSLTADIIYYTASTTPLRAILPPA